MTFNAVAALLALATAPAPVLAPQSLAVVKVHAPKTTLHLQVARSPSQRERGLMGVTKLSRHTGMLFVFDKDAPVDFWMKDTLIPLDMVFVGANGEVRKVFVNVPVVPLSTADSDIPLEGGTAKYVIELRAGEAWGDGLVTGARVSGLPHRE